MERRPTKAPAESASTKAWASDLAAAIVDRALPETWPADFAEGFEAVWRKALRRIVPRAWPASYQERLLGTLHIEFLERLSGEDVRRPLRDEIHRTIEGAIASGRSRRDIAKEARAFADERAEVLLSPILEGAALEASARIQGEIAGTREEVERIGGLGPKALHRFAARYNWDDGYVHLFEAIRSRHCSLGTAAMIYWRGRPHFFRQYEKRDEVPSYCIDNYDLLMEIERKVKRNAFRHHGIAYDPRKDGEDLTRTVYPGVGKKRDLPDTMYAATTVEGAVRFGPPGVKVVSGEKASGPKASGVRASVKTNGQRTKVAAGRPSLARASSRGRSRAVTS
jgi:hypothetical protein